MSVIASIRHKSDNVACLIDDLRYIVGNALIIVAMFWGMYLMVSMVIHDLRLFS